MQKSTFTTLGQHISIKHGFAFKGSFFTDEPNDNILLTPGNFRIGGGFKDSKYKYYVGNVPEEYILHPNDIIVTMTDLSKKGDTLGYAAKIPYSDKNFLHNQRIGLVNVKSTVLPNWVHWLMRTPHYQKNIVNTATGSTVRHTSPTKICAYRFKLPPLPIQKKIAEILDTADALKQKDKALIAKYNELTQSLFLDMFGDLSTNIHNFKVTTIGDVVNAIKDGPHVSPKYSESGIPILSTRNIRPFQLMLNELKFVSEETYKNLTRRFCPQKNDVLLTKGGTTGYAKLVDFDWDFCIWVHLAALRPKVNCINPKYLEAMLNSHYGYAQSQKYTRGIANKDLGLKRIVKIKLFLPPIELQNEFAERIKIIEQQKQLAEQSLKKSEDLFNCLLQKAFKGELVS